MSLGATMSAPASAWLAAARASSFNVGSFRIFPRLHHAAMAVLHVFAQAHVGDDEQRRQFLFQEPHGLLDDAIFGIGAGWLSRPCGPECRKAKPPEPRACGRGWPRAAVHRAKAGTRRAWRRWGGGFFVRRERTAAARVATRSNGFRPRVAATPPTAAAGAGDTPEIVQWIASSRTHSSFKAGRAKPKVRTDFEPQMNTDKTQITKSRSG